MKRNNKMYNDTNSEVIRNILVELLFVLKKHKKELKTKSKTNRR